jgi:hypothetical protein
VVEEGAVVIAVEDVVVLLTDIVQQGRRMRFYFRSYRFCQI